MSSPVTLARRTKILLSAALAAAGLTCSVALYSGQSAASSTADLSSAVAQGGPATDSPMPIGSLDIRPSDITTASAPAATDPAAAAAPFGPPGAEGEMGIPLLVFQAYKNGERVLGAEDPACHLPWWLLAGIGHTESGHAEAGRLYADGTTRGRILGPRLNGGIVGDAVITDTDHGQYDGDSVYDRAVGPMQFIPSTWRIWGVDGNADGKADPNNIFDATLAAGHYLCADDRDLSTAAGLKAAILSYNHSEPYYQTVLAWAVAYRDRAVATAGSPLPVVPDVTKVRPPLTPPTTSAGSTSASATGSDSATGSGSTSGPASTSSASSTTAASSATSSETSSTTASTTSSAAASTTSSAAASTAASTDSSPEPTSSASGSQSGSTAGTGSSSP